MAEISKYKLVWECKSETTFGFTFTVQKLKLEFVCECGNTITHCMSWENSEKFELISYCYCYKALKVDAKKVSSEDNTVVVMTVVGEFKIKKRELCGNHITWLAVHRDGSRFPFTTDKNGSYLITGKEKKMEPMDSGKKQKGKGKRKMEPKPMKVKRSRGESDRAVDDYDISQYNREERDEYESPKEDDYDDSYDPQDFIKSGPNDKEKVVKKSLGDVDKKKSKADGSGVDENKEGTGHVVDLRIFINPL